MIEFDARDAVYRGEGNSSIVVALKSYGKVIRLLKTADSADARDDAEDILRRHVTFNNEVIPQVLNPSLVQRPELIRLNAQQMETIRHVIRGKRPQFRLSKGIARDESFALLMPDYCTFDTPINNNPIISVEIKPKQGFLPSRDVLPEELRVKAECCRFGLSQYQKLQSERIDRRSEYCPLDLFSGCEVRMRHALHSLLRTPQNNFRVFRDIQLVFGDSVSRADFTRGFFTDDGTDGTTRLVLLVMHALTMPFDRNGNSFSGTRPIESQFCRLHSSCACTCTEHSVPVGCVLESVLSAQRRDSLDSFRANQMLDFLVARDGIDTVRERLMSSHVATADTCTRQLWEFLVSLTAKDCSIMMTFQRVPTATTMSVSVGGDCFACRVSVTDLDAKAIGKIEKTLFNDRRMIRSLISCLKINESQ